MTVKVEYLDSLYHPNNSLGFSEAPDVPTQDEAFLFPAQIQLVQNGQLLMKNRFPISPGEHPGVGAENDPLGPQDIEGLLEDIPKFQLLG